MGKEKIDEQKANKALWITGAIIALVIVFLLTNGFGMLGNASTTGSTISEYIPLEIGNSPVIGEANAPITIYIFSDFSCPYCAAASGANIDMVSAMQQRDPTWTAPMPGIIKDYVETGKVKIVWKYFPGHGTGKPAQRVGWALNEQGLFWEYHDLAFANTNDVSSLSKMKDLAESLGADMDKLDDVIKSGKYESQFEEDTNMGKSNGVTGTPAFFVNGKLISGAQSYSNLKLVIDSYL